MGNSPSFDRLGSEKFYAGEVVSKSIIARDSFNKGHSLSVKVTLPSKKATLFGAKSKPKKYSCRLNLKNSHFGVSLCGIKPPAHGPEKPLPYSDIARIFEEKSGLTLTNVTVGDERAPPLLLIPQPHLKQWQIISARQPFSRHSGTCLILNSKSSVPIRRKIVVGDFLRLGSVGLLVTETHNGSEHLALSETELQAISNSSYDILEDIFNNDMNQSLIGKRTSVFDSEYTAFEGENETLENNFGNENIQREMFQNPQCYMCFDEEDDPENDPLVAPCNCSGATKFVHINCLQKWYNSKMRNLPCIVSNQRGSQICGVCKAPYKTHRRLNNGETVPLFSPQIEEPYLSLTICTRHQSQEDLFGTRFHLSFRSRLNRMRNSSYKPFTIGRSQTCDMVLQYRTVSTLHAAIDYYDGNFYIQDLDSSNGSFLYIRDPITLPWGHSLNLKWGKGSISIKSPTMRSSAPGNDKNEGNCKLSWEEYSDLLDCLAREYPTSN